jgi:hypothetical protein
MDRCGAILLILVSALLQVHAQNQPPDTSNPSPITTDRPAFPASSVVVPAGSLQFENGFLETTAQSYTGFDCSEILVRLGILSKTELRFTAPDCCVNYNTGLGFGTGLGDLLLGVKQQLGPAGGFRRLPDRLTEPSHRSQYLVQPRIRSPAATAVVAPRLEELDHGRQARLTLANARR